MAKVRKWSVRIVFLALTSLSLVLALAWLVLLASRPKLSGTVSVPGLHATTDVTRDALGVVTIQAQSRADAFRALGFVHAQERFFEMDLLRRTASGELTELLGPVAREQDLRNRPHRMRDRARANFAQFAGRHGEALSAYAQGVNAGLDALSARPWPYLLLGARPERWEELDTMLAGYAMFLNLQDASGDRELQLAQLRHELPPPLFALLGHDGSRWDAPLEGAARGDAPLPSSDDVDLRALPAPAWPHVRPIEARGEAGSNSFAVGGALTRDGRAMLANDMHSALRVPALWFRARLVYPGEAAATDVTGFTLPGLPSIIVGSNGHVAWGFTNSYVQTVRWRVAENGEEGLVRPGPGGTRLAFDWLAYRPEALNLNLVAVNEARSASEALRIASGSGLPTGNFLVADRFGTIGWTLAGPVPEPDASGPSAAPRRSRPVVINPPAARLWTANNRLVAGDWLSQLGDGGYALGARGLQIRARLHARGQFAEQDLLAIQLDDHAPVMANWRLLLIREARRSPSGSALRRIAADARDWNGRADTGSTAYRIVRQWRLAVHARLLDGLTAPAQARLGASFKLPRLPQFEGVAWPLADAQPPHLLSRRFGSWPALFEDAAQEVARDMREAPAQDYTWGARNRARICHPLARGIPVLGARFLCMPADPLPGDIGVPRVQGPSFGATQRMVVVPSREAEGITHMPGGQSGHPLSPFFGAGHRDWVEGRPSPFLPGTSRYRLQLVPAT